MNKIIYILIIIFNISVFSSSKFTGDRLEQSCELFVKQYHGDSKIEILGKINDFEFEQKSVRASLEFDGKTYGNTFLNLIFRYKNSVLKSVKIPVKIKIFLKVPVFNKRLKPGDVLSASDFTIQKRFIEKNVITNANALIGTKLKRSVSIGEIIYPEYFEQMPVIEKGKLVSVLVVSGKVQIKTTGEALNDAKAGEKVRVKKNNSQLVIEGTALADGSIIIK